MQLVQDSARTGTSAELLVAFRFMEAGRIVSWPLVPCRYDLVVDEGAQLHRVQVKLVNRRIAKGEARYTFHCHLTKDRKYPVACSAYDYLCMVVNPGEVYVVPVGALACAHAPEQIVTRVQFQENDKRWAPFLNRFSVGPGTMPEPSIVRSAHGLKRSFWHAKRSASERKPYRRLTPADVAVIRELPIALSKAEEWPGCIPAEQIAQQFGVHVATLRNLLRGKRKDLRAPEAPGGEACGADENIKDA